MTKTKESLDITLSSIYFTDCELSSLKSIHLKDSSIPMRNTNLKPAIHALYGQHSKRLAYAQAAEYADKNNLNFTVIDFEVELSKPRNVQRMRPNELNNYDFMSTKWLTKAMDNEIELILRKQQKGLSNEINLTHHLATQPDHFIKLANHPTFKHIKVMVYLAKTAIYEKFLSIGVIPKRHWKYIRNPRCKFNSHITVKT